jgi:hypothetical protein
MDAEHHDLVLAVTSHLPHLIAYTIVGTASDLEAVTQSEVIKYSAGGFRDFTRIAASDPTMWRDVFLNNRDAVLDMLQRFTEDLMGLQKAIRVGDGAALFDHFSHTARSAARSSSRARTMRAPISAAFTTRARTDGQASRNSRATAAITAVESQPPSASAGEMTKAPITRGLRAIAWSPPSAAAPAAR